MLTIGYCTRKIDIAYIDMLKETCGVDEVDIVPIEDHGDMSMTEAYIKIYNEHPNPYMVFIHDDLTFKTKDWGKVMIDLLDKNDFGLIGVAGSTFITNDKKGWWQYVGCTYGQVWHRQKDGTPFLTRYSNALPKGTMKEVVVLDGLFIGIKRCKTQAAWNDSLKGFHYYDMDYSMHNYIRGVKVGVTTDIELIHNSVGETDESWEYEQQHFYFIYENYFPVYLGKNFENNF